MTRAYAVLVTRRRRNCRDWKDLSRGQCRIGEPVESSPHEELSMGRNPRVALLCLAAASLTAVFIDWALQELVRPAVAR